MTALPSASTVASLRRAACLAPVGGLEAWLVSYIADEEGRPLVVSRGQRALIRDLERVLRRDPGDAVRGLAAMCARGHGKSTVMKAAILHALVVRGFRYAALLTAGTVYEQFSRDLRSLVRGEGPLLRDDDGRARLVVDWDLRPGDEHPEKRDRLWNVEDFVFWVGGWERGQRRRIGARGMTGGNGNVRGLIDGADRPDLLWADDPMKDLEAANREITERVKSFVRGAYWPCGAPDARYVTTGTPFNDHDLISEQTSPTGGWPSLLRRKLPAIHAGTGALFMGHYWTRPKLEERRELIGSRAFAEQYLLDPQGGGIRIFEPGWIVRWMTPEAGVPRRSGPGDPLVFRALYTDPSLGRTSRSDLSAITVVDRSAGTSYVWHSSMTRRRPQQIVEDHLDLWLRFRPDAHAVEDEGAQELLIPIFEAAVKARSLPEAAVPELLRTRGVPKPTRIKRLSAPMEFGRLRFVTEGDHRDLRIQAGGYQGLAAQTEQDDGLDSLEGAVRLASREEEFGVN